MLWSLSKSKLTSYIFSINFAIQVLQFFRSIMWRFDSWRLSSTTGLQWMFWKVCRLILALMMMLMMILMILILFDRCASDRESLETKNIVGIISGFLGLSFAMIMTFIVIYSSRKIKFWIFLLYWPLVWHLTNFQLLFLRKNSFNTQKFIW